MLYNFVRAVALLVVLIMLHTVAGCASAGFIGGEKGDAEWALILDLGIIAPISIGFKGVRKSEPDSESSSE